MQVHLIRLVTGYLDPHPLTVVDPDLVRWRADLAVCDLDLQTQARLRGLRLHGVGRLAGGRGLGRRRRPGRWGLAPPAGSPASGASVQPTNRPTASVAATAAVRTGPRARQDTAQPPRNPD